MQQWYHASLFHVTLHVQLYLNLMILLTKTYTSHTCMCAQKDECFAFGSDSWVRHKKILDKLEKDLVQYMNASQLLPLLKTKGILSYDEEEDLEFKYTAPREKNKFIISLIPKKVHVRALWHSCMDTAGALEFKHNNCFPYFFEGCRCSQVISGVPAGGDGAQRPCHHCSIAAEGMLWRYYNTCFTSMAGVLLLLCMHGLFLCVHVHACTCTT